MTTYVAIDFDGTIVEHEYPDIGKPVPGAFRWMKEFKKRGARLFLWTMRDGKELKQAVDFCREHGIEFDGINENRWQKSWTNSPKCYAHIYIDDMAFGCPMRTTKNSRRAFVDWRAVGPAVLEKIRFYA